jgi:hypothetical protein
LNVTGSGKVKSSSLAVVVNMQSNRVPPTSLEGDSWRTAPTPLIAIFGLLLVFYRFYL